MKRHLITPADVKACREALLEKQKDRCAVTGRGLNSKDAVLDHDHDTQHVRGAVHRQINTLIGKIENGHKRYTKWWLDEPLPVLLRFIADYLDGYYENMPYHPKWQQRVRIDFCKLNSEGQKWVLKQLSVEPQKNTGDGRRKAIEAFVKTNAASFEELQDLIQHAALLHRS